MQIRIAKLTDADGIRQLKRAGLKKGTWKYTAMQTYSKAKHESLLNQLKQNSGFRHFVAIEDRIIIGTVMYAYRTKGRTQHRIEFGWGVHPYYEGKGVATKLLRFALADAKKRGYKRAEAEMAIKNIGSWKIAERCGFVREGVKKKALRDDSGKYIDTYFYGKILK